MKIISIWGLLIFSCMANINAQNLDFNIGINLSDYYTHGTGSGSAKTYPGPSLGFNAFDWKIRKKHSGFGIHFYQNSGTYNSSQDFHYFSGSYSAKFTNLYTTFNFYPIYKGWRNNAIQLRFGYFFNIKIGTHIESHLMEEDYYFHTNKDEKNKYNKWGILSFPNPGIAGMLNIKLYQKGKLNFHLKNSFYLCMFGEMPSPYDNFFVPIGSRHEISLGFNFLSNETKTRRLVKYQAHKEQQKINQTRRKNHRNEKRKLDNNALEMNVGINSHIFNLEAKSTSTYRRNGFTVGIKVVNWAKHPKTPVMALAFQQINCHYIQFQSNSSEYVFQGDLQKNMLVYSIYSPKLIFPNSYLDFRIGLNLNLLLLQQTRGLIPNPNSINFNDKYMYVNKNILDIYSRVSAGPEVSITGPLIRQKNFCIKYRMSYGLHYADYIQNQIWSIGNRAQFDIILAKNSFKKHQ